jgi:hypothetical protein
MAGPAVSQGPDGNWYDAQGQPTDPPPTGPDPTRTGPPVARHGGTTGSGGTDAPGTAGNVGQPTSQPLVSPPASIAPFSGVTYPQFTPPPLPDALQKPFTLPTAQDLLTNDPGYMARYQLGQDAIQRSAAAQGTLLSGGTLKGLQQAGQDYASSEYNNYYNQLLGTRQQQSADYLNLAYGPSWQQNQGAVNQYGQLYGQYKDLIANNRNAQNDYINQLLEQQRIGAGAAAPPPTSSTSNV